MKKLFALLRLVKNYRAWIVGHILSNILAAFFTVLSLPIARSLFEVFFARAEASADAPPLTVDTFNDWLNYQLITWIKQSDILSDQIIQICSVLIILFFFKNLFTYLAMFFMAPVRNGVLRDLRAALFDKLNVLPLSYYSEEKKGDLMSRMSNDVQEVEWSIMTVLERLIRDPIVLIGALLYMLMTSFQLTMYVLILLLFTGGLIGLISRKLKKQSVKVQENLGKLMVLVDENISGLKLIKAYNAEAGRATRFKQVNDHQSNLLTRLLWRRDMASPLSEFLGILAVCVLFIIGARMVYEGHFNDSAFLTYLLAFFFTISPAKALASTWYNIQKGTGALERINEVLVETNDIVNHSGKTSIDQLTKGIVLQDLSFTYNIEHPNVLNNLNLEVKKGEKIALVGRSGSGKSTLVDLLLRFYDIQSGEILIDQKDIKSFDLHALRNLFSIVTQDPILFNTSIKDNILFGAPNSSDAEVIAAAKKAYAHDFILDTPQGYDTTVGDGGSKLSGGQKQRIALARAIIADPEIIVLDEATSALDSESEILVQQALDEILKDRTSIIIAHRLSTIQKADRIYVLDKGEIVAVGNHKELMDLPGIYNDLVKMQNL